jgi:hypothetical protein
VDNGYPTVAQFVLFEDISQLNHNLFQESNAFRYTFTFIE